MFLSLFQTASGSLHYPSILTAASWFFGSIVSGIFIFSLLIANRAERLKSFAKEEQYRAELKDAREQIATFEIRPLPIRLKALLDEIDPKILIGLKQGTTYFTIQATQAQFTRLQNLYSEKEAASYIDIDPGEDRTLVVSKDALYTRYDVSIRLKTALLTAPLHGFNTLNDKKK